MSQTDLVDAAPDLTLSTQGGDQTSLASVRFSHISESERASAAN